MKAPIWFALFAVTLFAPGVFIPRVGLYADDRGALLPTVDARATRTLAVEAIASLADPAKLATLGMRGANPRVQKITYWLLMVKQQGGKPDAVIDDAFLSFGWKGTPQGEETKLTMLRNLARAEYLGCNDAPGMDEMRRGHAPSIHKGQFYGDEMSVDHVLPRAIVPQLDNVLANLELMPGQMNRGKSDKLEARQVAFAHRFVAAGIIDAASVPWAAPFEGQPAAAKLAPPPAPKTTGPPVPATATALTGSKRSPVFHKATCSSVAAIVKENLLAYATREEAIAVGKRPCPKCNP